MQKVLLIFISLFFVATCHAADKAQQAEAFTRSFYDWYLEKGKHRSVESVLLHKKAVLSPTLYKMLDEDRAAQAKSPGEIVGLDFDPFLNAQDVAQKYEVGKASLKGKSYWIDLFGLWNGKKSKKPDLLAELECSTTCVFVNFHYGPDRNLISVLNALKKDRKL